MVEHHSEVWTWSTRHPEGLAFSLLLFCLRAILRFLMGGSVTGWAQAVAVVVLLL
jgi:hypothetical protein